MDNKVTILEPNKTETLTYTIFRDSEKNLYLAVYREDLAQKDLKGVVCFLKPEEVRERIKNLDKWETWEDLISCPYNLHNFLMLGTIPLLFTMIDEEGLTEISLEEPVKELIYGKH